MEDKEGYLISICIPTCKRADILKLTLDSIYESNVNREMFEICISDNSDTDETQKLIASKYSDKKNLVYKKTTVKGFLNSVEALKLGSGKLLKLHNDYSIFQQESFEKILRVVEKYTGTDSILFFSMGERKNREKIMEFKTFDDFLYNISYYSTWSSSFAVWKTDMHMFLKYGTDVNFMYPHTSILFSLTHKELYVVDDTCYVTNVTPKKKGGYNLANNFVNIYLTMVENLLAKGAIQRRTFKKIKNEIIMFTAFWNYNVKAHNEIYTFTFENLVSIITKKCGVKGLILFYFWRIYFSFKYFMKKLIKKRGYK